MSKNRTWVIITAITILFTIGLAYRGYRFYGAYESIQLAQKIHGYKSFCKGLPSPMFAGEDWMGVLIDNGTKYTDGAHNIVPYDIDGDGGQDVVFATKTDNGLGWLENNGSSIAWRMTWIDNSCTRSFNVRVADLNRDGQNDVIASEDDALKGGTLHLYSYSGDPRIQRNWVDHKIANFPAGEGVSVFEIADLDGDGDLDMVTGNHQGDVYVLENPYPNIVGHSQEWNRSKVSHSDGSTREIDTGDIDGDGDLDIAVSAAASNVFLLYFNNLIKQGEKQ